jgi:site-specific DNA-cytosine methylase
MTYGSVCSGIEAASVAFAPLGWKAAFFSEIDASRFAVRKMRLEKRHVFEKYYHSPKILLKD